MIPAVKTAGMAALFGGIIIGGIVHFCLGFFINRIRHWLPPLVTGLIVLTIGLTLLPIGIKYAAGGVPLLGLNGVAIICHGGSSPKAIMNAVENANLMVERKVNEHIKERIKQ